MNTAQQALELLRNKMTAAELDDLSEEQRQQFAEICHHWSMLASPANKQSRKISDAMPDQENKNVEGMEVIRYKKGKRDKVERIVQGCQRLNSDGLWFVGYVARDLAGRFPRIKLDVPNIDEQPLSMKPILELAELINDDGLDKLLANIDKAFNRCEFRLARHQTVADVIPFRAS